MLREETSDLQQAAAVQPARHARSSGPHNLQSTHEVTGHQVYEAPQTPPLF